MNEIADWYWDWTDEEIMEILGPCAFDLGYPVPFRDLPESLKQQIVSLYHIPIGLYD